MKVLMGKSTMNGRLSRMKNYQRVAEILEFDKQILEDRGFKMGLAM